MALSKRWLEHIEAWQSSGLKQSAYCRQHSLNSRTFAARLSDYRKGRGASPFALIPVQIKPPVTEVIVFTHAQGHRLELPASVSASWLAELLRCLA